jgi:pimeloyl-ACP methyl ester carboxylesterase
VRRSLLRVFNDPARIPPGCLEAAVGVLGTRNVFYAYRHAVRNILPPDSQAALARLGHIRCPALVIWGRQDRIVPASFAPRLASELPAARSHLIEACGHAPHLEYPDLVAGWIAGWYPTGAPEENTPCPTIPS